MHARSSARLACLAAAAVVLSAARAGAAMAQVVTCDKCHGNRDFLVGKGGPHGDSALYVPSGTLHDTRHATLRCAQCHVGYDAGYPHQATSRVVPCQTCHVAAGRDWEASIHAANSARTGDAPTCVGCHGSHTVYGAADRRSPSNPLNVAAMCGRCHADPRIIGTYFATADRTTARTAVAHFARSVHGNALTRAGLVVSATCNDCHRAHKVLPADSSGSSVNRANIPATCGACHTGVAEVFDSSAHGAALRSLHMTTTGHSAPVCVDCHSAHEIVRADEPQWKLGVVEECGSCHERLVETYFETYHGKVTRLGFTLAATCSDCHTPHDMRPASDARSSVYPENLVATCGRCHAAANANFVRYQPHGDPRDRAKYPLLHWTWLFMTMLLVGTMSFFLLHTFLWLVRITIDRLRRRRPGPPGDPAMTPRALNAADRGAGPYLWRFTPLQRALHAMVIVSFFGLVITGLPLHFAYAGWARNLIGVVGGLHAAGLIHRTCAMITFGYFGIYVGSIAYRILRSTDRLSFFWGPDSMVPQPKDVRDVIQMFKWFLGKGPQPRFDRFSYMEKFDHLGVFWGVAIIGASGLLLWFPEFFARFLPGWAFNVATIVHGDEALLAMSFIFTIHFFNAHLRPEKFPIDLVIFTGRATTAYMEEEHPLEYERRRAAGTLDALTAPPVSRAGYLWAVVLGFLSLALGIFLVILVLWALLH